MGGEKQVVISQFVVDELPCFICCAKYKLYQQVFVLGGPEVIMDSHQLSDGSKTSDI